MHTEEQTERIVEQVGHTEEQSEHIEVQIGHTEEQSEQTGTNESKRSGSEETISVSQVVYELIATILMSMIVLLLLMTFFFRQFTVDGSSMNDTLLHDERLIVTCFDDAPKCGDIVIVTHGKELQEMIVKRVIATEGQWLDIDFSTGDVMVDGVLLKEDYVKGVTKAAGDSQRFPMQIPQGYVFVMGDNRENSLDSRSERIGLIPKENIIGKAVMRWYPLEKIGLL